MVTRVPSAGRAPWESSQPAPVADFASKREERAQELAAKVDAAVERLAEQLSEGHTAEFLEALAFFARFRRYSWNNAILIRSQCPEATLVAGLRRWNQLGYRVRAGAKALWIWAPLTRKEVDAVTGEEREVVVGFRPAPVFDCSQLANLADKPLPDPIPSLPDDVEEVFLATKARIEAQGIAVEERALPRGILGVSEGGRILVRSGLGSRVRLFVALHEYVHEVAHHGEEQRTKSRDLREFEAEAAAYVAAAAIGLENPTSRDYLLSYHGTTEILKASMTTIQRLTREVLRVVEVDPPAGRLAA